MESPNRSDRCFQHLFSIKRLQWPNGQIQSPPTAVQSSLIWETYALSKSLYWKDVSNCTHGTHVMHSLVYTWMMNDRRSAKVNSSFWIFNIYFIISNIPSLLRFIFPEVGHLNNLLLHNRMTMAISVTLEYQESLLLWSTFRDYETKILFHTVVSTLENSLLETQYWENSCRHSYCM